MTGEKAIDQATIRIHSTSRNLQTTDYALIALSILLVIAFTMAALFAKQYATVDEGGIIGEATIADSEMQWAIIDIQEDKSATIKYAKHEIKGTLKLEGAEVDTVLYSLSNPIIVDEPEADDAILFLRIPREGFEGDYSGVWMLYYSCPSLDENRSLWIFANKDGTALTGTKFRFNALNEPRFKLRELSTMWQWRKNGTRIELTPMP